MNYKQIICDSMLEFSKDNSVIFVGYGLEKGRANGTLAGIPNDRIAQLGEMPVAENLLIGVAIGLALKGRKVIAYIERFDFALLAADVIVNQLDKIGRISNGEFSPGVMIRCNVGGKSRPLFTGLPHTQDLTAGFAAMVSFPVVRYTDSNSPPYVEAFAALPNRSTMIVEYRDLY